MPDADWLRLPMPALTVESIVYLDPAGDSQTLAPAAYAHFGDVIVRPYGTQWPATLRQAGAVQIRFTAGFGPDQNDVPESLRMAALLLISSWYDMGAIGSEVPAAVASLVSPYRALRAEVA